MLVHFSYGLRGESLVRATSAVLCVVPGREFEMGHAKPQAPPTETGDSPAAVLLKMAITTIGIYTCFLTWGLVHERVATHDYMVDGKPVKLKTHLVTNAVGSACTTLVAGLAVVVLQVLGRRVGFVSLSVKQLFTLGLSQAFAAPFGLAGAKYMSYPLYLTVKMTKMVPVVVVGTVWHRARYTLQKYLAVVLITGGVVAFSLLQDSGKAAAVHTSFLGIVLCFINMTLDGYTNSTQDAINQRSKPHSMQLMAVSGLFTFIVCVIALVAIEFAPPALHTAVLKPELSEALHVFAQQPQAVTDVLSLGVLNAMGQVFILTGMRYFGSLSIIAIMITRKVGSVFLSIFFHGHSIAGLQMLALVAVIIGVVVDTIDGINKHRKKKAA